MDYVEVADEDISPEECTAEAGWLVSHRQRGTRALNKLGLTATSTAKNDAGGRTESRKPCQRHRKQRQQPALPREDIKVILRPREGLDVTKVSSARLRDGVFCAIGLKEQEAEGDLLRVNPDKNIIVTSTPSMDRAKKYNSISKICIAGKTYELTTYAAPPEDTAKGVIHNIPDYDTAEDITRSLVYNKNPTILQAQRMGKTNSAVTVFEGNKWDTAWTSARRPKTKCAALAVQRIHEKGINVTPSVQCVVGIIPQETKTVRTGSKRRTYYERDSEKENDRMAPANMAGTETQSRRRRENERKGDEISFGLLPSSTPPRIRERQQRGTAAAAPADISQDRHPKAADTRLQEKPSRTRQARAQSLDKRFAHLEDVVYVDAADYSSRDAMAISVVDRQGNLINSGTVFTTSSGVGEEAAIALAMTSSSRIKFIVSDSKPAILNYTKGRISSEALKILRTGFHGDRVRGVLIVWAPAHSGLPGNENAHDAARGLTDRADVTNIIDAHSFRRSDRDRLVAYRDVINHYRLGRAKCPAADRTLSKWQAVAWRLLQTNTFPNPVAYSRCYPGLYSSACKHCGDRADLQHMVWACPFKNHKNNRNRAQILMLNIRISEQWETVLLSSDPGEQVRLVQMAEAAAKEQGLLSAD
ncbi:hypothetical protein HPB47_007307 [Ixodes persulcatus]|uniref:Uncharacterized protein n=1 Tax=Ixodes persulcatus TaxID=34615 RepID=A0AC60P805_IXOPE|nr:hypothetical protein HPB47_007307 [Ixodes persulcatus]